MDWGRELFVILFLGVLALASGAQIGWGIHHLRRGDRVRGLYVLGQGLFIILVLVLLGDERFLPPGTSLLALAVTGFIFVGSILAQIWFLPLLVQDFGEKVVTAFAWGGAFVVGGLGFAFAAILQNNTAIGICGGALLAGVGLVWLVPGARAAVRQAFGRTPPVPRPGGTHSPKRARRDL